MEMKKALSFEVSVILIRDPRYLWSSSTEKCFLSIKAERREGAGLSVMVTGGIPQGWHGVSGEGRMGVVVERVVTVAIGRGGGIFLRALYFL